MLRPGAMYGGRMVSAGYVSSCVGFVERYGNRKAVPPDITLNDIGEMLRINKTDLRDSSHTL
jgi:hypothetical protein